MGGKPIKLNLGCGIVYRPGYINIDKFDERVADETYNAISLPYENDSVDIIEAYHILEHFDLIHSKYAMSEWFRVLKTSGRLIIETPDLEKSLKKFRKGDVSRQSATLRWIYGTDDPGMSHKSGFSFMLLENLLTEVGFVEITKKKQTTHSYEPGMRLECSKPADSTKQMFFANFRKSLIDDHTINDSEILYSLEDYCIRDIFNMTLKGRGLEDNSNMLKAVSKLALCNPALSLIFLRSCFDSGMINESSYAELKSITDFFVRIEFHKKLFSLWSRSKKELGNADRDFRDFTDRMEALLFELYKKRTGYEERLEYISSLPPLDIPVFNFYYVQLEGRILFNRGVKYFHKRKFREAVEYFRNSIRINPENSLSYWNLARLGVILGEDAGSILEKFGKASKIITDKRISGILASEMEVYRGKGPKKISREPLSEYTFQS